MRQRITFSRQSMLEKGTCEHGHWQEDIFLANDVVAAHIAMPKARPGQAVYRVCLYRGERDARRRRCRRIPGGNDSTGPNMARNCWEPRFSSLWRYTR